MNFRRRILYRLRIKLTDLAHRDGVSNKWHDRLEFVAYKIVDPLIWV